MAERMGADRVRYRFSPLERRGVIAGWRGGQIASVAVGLVFAVLALRSRPSVGGVLLGVVSAGAGVTMAFWPVRGRTGEQWLPLLAHWLWSASTGGGRRQPAPAPGNGHEMVVDRRGSRTAAPDTRTTRVRPAARRPRVFDGLSLIGVPLSAEPTAPDFGVIVDRRCRTATAVLAVRGDSFALLGPGDQDARISAWARVLSAMAREGSEVHRIQWIESCLPDDGAAVRRHCTRHTVLGPESPAGRSYQTLVSESSPVTRRHQVLLGLSIHTARSARSIRASGRGMAGTGAVLGREVLSLHQALDGAEVIVDGVLGPGALARVVARAWTPMRDTMGDTGEGRGSAASWEPRPMGDRGPDLSDPAPLWPWPMATEPQWDSVHTDATWHATYWIAEWPRVDVTPDFLGPLLFSPLRRSIALTMEPVSPSRAARQVAQARTADLADGELRRRGGFLVTARHTREKESVEDRDAELADGHAQYRFSGYVTVTADTRDELTGACAAVEQAAGQARIEIRLLYGEQDAAFACSLPLCRGLS
ncbi:MAG TPA: SCO6880 family protein [Acidimicrobiales bacterium]|nr:SCO6880 family protein [Acidimicrobiales bacterium]